MSAKLQAIKSTITSHITQHELKRVLNYDPDSGIFTWRVSVGTSSLAGKVAGCLSVDGYVGIRVMGTRYQAHRLAWLYVYGALPSGDIDHKNCIKKDNRISNLREASRAQNKWNVGRNKNNTSGHKGVSFAAGCKKWHSIINVHGIRISLGRFDKIEDAAAAYNAAAVKYHGEFIHESVSAP